MLTPKEQMVKSQALTSKKKRIFRILQGSNCDGNYCATLNDNRLKNDLDAKMKTILEQQRGKISTTTSLNSNDKEPVKPAVVPGDKAEQRQLRKAQRQEKRKSIKCPELACGLNETLKLVKNKKVSMVWVDQSLAQNLLNVLHKLCAVNQVFCLDLDLTNLKSLMNMTTLSVVSFRTSVQHAESTFNSIYQLVITTVFKAKDKVDTKEKVALELEKAPKPPTPPSPATVAPLFTANINFYIPNSADTYSEIMRKRLRPIEKEDKRDEFEKQLSFISVSSRQEQNLYFPDYSKTHKRGGEFKCEISIDRSKQSEQQSRESSKKMAEVLFGIDKLDRSIEGSKTQFKSPKLVKGQMPNEQSNQKKRTNKQANKNTSNNNKKMRKV